MTEYIIIILIILSLSVITFFVFRNAMNKRWEIYEITSDIKSLDIKIEAADVIIQQGKMFYVDSNIKNLLVSEKNGVLTISDDKKHSINYINSTLKLYIPKKISLENVDITTGAAKLTVDSLSANSVDLRLGSGKAQLGELNADSNINITGGAGEITVNGGILNNLALCLGVGSLNMTTTLLGKNDLKFGVGSSDLKLIGSKNDYIVDVEKGIGSVTINGSDVSGVSSEKCQHYIGIKGGIGAVKVVFQEK